MSKHYKKQVVQAVKEWEMELVEMSVRRVIGKYGLRDQDEEDKKQEFLLYVLIRKRSVAFGKLEFSEQQQLVTKWLDHKVWKMKQERRTKKVQVFERAQSLSDLIVDAELGKEITLDQSEAVAEPGKTRVELWELSQDVQSVAPRLTKRQKFVCAELSQGTKKGWIAKKLRIHKRTLRYELARIRKIFTDHGLKGYV